MLAPVARLVVRAPGPEGLLAPEVLLVLALPALVAAVAARKVRLDRISPAAAAGQVPSLFDIGFNR